MRLNFLSKRQSWETGHRIAAAVDGRKSHDIDGRCTIKHCEGARNLRVSERHAGRVAHNSHAKLFRNPNLSGLSYTHCHIAAPTSYLAFFNMTLLAMSSVPFSSEDFHTSHPFTNLVPRNAEQCFDHFSSMF